MKLLKLLDDLDIVEIWGNPNRIIKGISHNSKLVKADYIFVAIEGIKFDGHNFINDAVINGASVIIVSKNIKITEDVTIIKVKDTRLALSKVASAFYGYPAKELKIIGITGTNGKTTTTYFSKKILDYTNRNVGFIGSLGVHINGLNVPTSLTTPESIELQKILRQMVNSDIDTCVMEVSSHAIELNRITDCDFDIGVFTNLTHEHLDFHHTMEDYFKTKSKLFLMSKECNIINIDDPYGKRLYNMLAGSTGKLITYGINESAHIRAERIQMHDRFSTFLLNVNNQKAEVKINLPGKYNIYNALASAACGYALGANMNEIKNGIESVRHIPGRFEVIKPSDLNLNIIIDYAHTPDGFRNLLTTVRKYAKGRIVIVFGCVGERDQSKRSIMGSVASKLCDLSILTTDNCRSENPAEIIEDIKKGFSRPNYIEILDREEAIRYAVLNSKKDDTILITGKGHEKRQIIGDKIYYFDEHEIINKAINEFNNNKSILYENEDLYVSKEKWLDSLLN